MLYCITNLKKRPFEMTNNGVRFSSISVFEKKNVCFAEASVPVLHDIWVVTRRHPSQALPKCFFVWIKAKKMNWIFSNTICMHILLCMCCDKNICMLSNVCTHESIFEPRFLNNNLNCWMFPAIYSIYYCHTSTI